MGNDRVLLVDDDPVFRALVAEELEVLGFQRDFAGDLDTACDALESGRFGRLLTDLHFPVYPRAGSEVSGGSHAPTGLSGRSGLDLIRMARASDPWMVIVAMTGYPSHDTLERVLAAGADSLLAKPFSLERLARVLSPRSARPRRPA